MKLKALKNFRDEDKKRGRMVSRMKGETFEKDPSDEGKEIYCLIQGGQVTVIDKGYIPEKAKYRCIFGFSFTQQDGKTRMALPNNEYELPQEVACKFLTSGHIRPIDEKWTPRRLLSASISEQPIKKMFDEPQKESWVRKGMR